ncbi:hypothetical protein [Hymenobacter cellulosilyticus]|uniref:Uncharacterized protein n=1 Tax=Hymenobacter cellulosilyticus TaxID=2932248 RepID=A0A8T9QFB9_9BACT|nr:hypothetical protein [Hymenobacter cellulosilyticus]UOQ74510.1 hypothetical protein MUN79_11875 [Hymenobacter cellulosilyticus]
MTEEHLKFLISIWGASIATILAAIKVVEFLRERISIKIKANLIFAPSNTEGKSKGTLIQVEGRGAQEVLLSVSIVNTGRRPIQITAIVVEENSGSSIQIIPQELPAVLAPLTSVVTTIQKEWIDGIPVKEFGVLDALGNMHTLKREDLINLVQASNSYPSNRKQYRNKDSGEIVTAFQGLDKSVIINAPKKL